MQKLMLVATEHKQKLFLRECRAGVHAGVHSITQTGGQTDLEPGSVRSNSGSAKVGSSPAISSSSCAQTKCHRDLKTFDRSSFLPPDADLSARFSV